MDEFDKCKFCIHYDDYEGCIYGCYEHEDYKPNKTKLIDKAKEKCISMLDLIALIDLE